MQASRRGIVASSVGRVRHIDSAGGRLAAARVQAGLTQVQLARLVGRSAGWVSKAERGEVPLTDLRTLRALAEGLRVPVAQLIGDLEGVAPHLGEDELQRRAFLAGLGIVAIGAAGADLLSRLSAVMDRPSRVDAASVDALAAATVQLGQLYGRLPAVGLWGLANGHLAQLTRLAVTAPVVHRPRLASLAAESGGICAWLAADLDRQDDALVLLDTALRAAAAAGDEPLAAYLLASATVLTTFRERAPRAVIEVLTGSTRGVRMDAASPATAAWACTLRASAHARLGERDAALHALAAAEDQLGRPDAGPHLRRPRQPFFDRSRLDGEHGVVAVRLGGIRAEATVSRLTAALGALPAEAKIRARYGTALAGVLAEAGDVEGATGWAHRSLDSAADVPRSLGQVQALRAGLLARWPRHPAVQDLDDRLAQIPSLA